jgi:hypothetical protein
MHLLDREAKEFEAMIMLLPKGGRHSTFNADSYSRIGFLASKARFFRTKFRARVQTGYSQVWITGNHHVSERLFL